MPNLPSLNHSGSRTNHLNSSSTEAQSSSRTTTPKGGCPAHCCWSSEQSCNGQGVQLLLPLVDARESQAERCRRLLSGELRGKVTTAAALTFTPQAEREAARKAQEPPSWVLPENYSAAFPTGCSRKVPIVLPATGAT